MRTPSPPLAFLLDFGVFQGIGEYVGLKTSTERLYLRMLRDERAEGEVHRLNGVHRIGEDALSIGRHVHAGVRHCRLHDAEGGERAARVEDGSHAHRRELVPIPVEAHGDDPIGFSIAYVEKRIRMFRRRYGR